MVAQTNYSFIFRRPEKSLEILYDHELGNIKRVGKGFLDILIMQLLYPM